MGILDDILNRIKNPNPPSKEEYDSAIENSPGLNFKGMFDAAPMDQSQRVPASFESSVVDKNLVRQFASNPEAQAAMTNFVKEHGKYIPPKEEEESTPENDPAAFAMAEEDASDEDKEPALPAQGTLPLSKKDAAAIKAIPESETSQEQKSPSEISSFLADLKKAQAESKSNLSGVALAEAFDQALQANARRGTSEVKVSGYDTFKKLAERPVEDLIQQLKGRQDEAAVKQLEYKTASEQEMRDPNSDVSKNMRSIISSSLSKIGMHDAAASMGKMSAAQIKASFGDYNLDKLVTAHDNAETRKLLAVEKKQSKNESRIDKLRTELTRMDKDIGYIDSQEKYNQLKELMQSGKLNSTDDIIMVYDIMKSLDPTSVVREGEFKTMVDSMGGYEKLKNLPNRILKGDLFTPQMRSKLIGRFGNIVDTRHRVLTNKLQPYIKDIEESGLDAAKILPEIYSKKQAKSVSYSSTQEKAIEHVMKRNNINRESAIKALKDAGKL